MNNKYLNKINGKLKIYSTIFQVKSYNLMLIWRNRQLKIIKFENIKVFIFLCGKYIIQIE